MKEPLCWYLESDRKICCKYLHYLQNCHLYSCFVCWKQQSNGMELTDNPIIDISLSPHLFSCVTQTAHLKPYVLHGSRDLWLNFNSVSGLRSLGWKLICPEIQPFRFGVSLFVHLWPCCLPLESSLGWVAWCEHCDKHNLCGLVNSFQATIPIVLALNQLLPVSRLAVSRHTVAK